MRYRIELSYNGKNYHGWQIQPNAISVQEVLQTAFSTLLNTPISIMGAGRTDTSVHAEFFVAHFDLDTEIPNTEQLCFRMNHFLPKDIAIHDIRLADEGFRSRFSATSRTYEYRFHFEKNPFLTYFSYFFQYELDVEAMEAGAKILFEYTDFTSFSKVNTDAKTNNCTIMQAEWFQTQNQLIFKIKANRFLRNMVRAIVGTLLELGIGKITLDEFRDIIEQQDRSKAGKSAPGHALFLTDIEY